MITSLSRVSHFVALGGPKRVHRRELSTIIPCKRQSVKHQHAFMMTCSCGIGSSPADHKHFHKRCGKSVNFSWESKMHAVSENLPIGVLSVSMSVLASFGTGFLTPSQINVLVGTVFTLVGIPSVSNFFLSILRTHHKVKTVLDVHSLMTLSALAALATGQGAEGAFLLSLFQLAHAIQHRIVTKAKRDVNQLADLVPDTAHVIGGDGQVESVDCHSVGVGSFILVRPGSVCPIDGRLAKPHTVAVQLAHLTGEAASVEKRAGDGIPAGAVNTATYPIQIETTHLASMSTLQRIVDLAQSAAKSRPKIASWINEVAPKYASAVLAGTASIAVAGPIFFGLTWTVSGFKALSFLVAASPCALLVASPVAQAAAVSTCSRRGIILSGGAQALDRFATAKSVAVDKTGTLTEGRMRVASIETVHGDEKICLHLGAVLGRFGSSHPVSQGIGRELPWDTPCRLVPMSVKETPGESVSGTVVDQSTGTEYPVSISRSVVGKSLTTIRAGEHECIVSLEDRVRPGIERSIQRSELPIFMLTGDSDENAMHVAEKIGLGSDHVFSALSPEDKAQIVSRKLSCPVMVGDGVNDAPALAGAKAGGVAVAPSATSESIQSAAVSVADAVVLADERTDPLDSVLFLIKKAKQTSRIVNMNLGLAVSGMVGTAIAVTVGGCPLWLAVLLHEGSTVLVVLNSLRNL